MRNIGYTNTNIFLFFSQEKQNIALNSSRIINETKLIIIIIIIIINEVKKKYNNIRAVDGGDYGFMLTLTLALDSLKINYSQQST